MATNSYLYATVLSNSGHSKSVVHQCLVTTFKSGWIGVQVQL